MAVDIPFIDERLNGTSFSENHYCKVMLRAELPKLALLSNFLSPGECQQLIGESSARLANSGVMASDGISAATSKSRTSYDVSFHLGEDALIGLLDERIAALCNWPVQQTTGWQVVRYRPEEYFAPHSDFFPPDLQAQRSERQRIASVIVYLNDVECGGATDFPDAGLSIVPTMGTALFFSYQSARRASMTLHAGAAPLAGEKWIAVKWFNL